MPTEHEPRDLERRAYDAPLPTEDVWLCEHLRRTAPEMLSAMYRADYVPPKY